MPLNLRSCGRARAARGRPGRAGRIGVALLVSVPLLSPSHHADATSCPLSTEVHGGVTWFLVGSAADLARIGTAGGGDCPIDGNYRQVTDIDLGAWIGSPGSFNEANAAVDSGGWVPINGSAGHGIEGVYDGRGLTISGLTIDRPGEEQRNGLFAGIDGTVRDLRLVDVDVSAGSRAAGLTSTIRPGGTVEGVFVEGIVRSIGSRIGLLAALNDGGVVRDSSTAGQVLVPGGDVQNEAGGLLGTNAGVVERSSSSATLSTTDWRQVGGLVGFNNGQFATIRDSIATGPVTGHQEVGGLVGLNSGRIERSAATGPVTGTTSVGGLVGRHQKGFNTHPDPAIMDSFARGPVSGTSAVGGLLGDTHVDQGDVIITRSYSRGAVSGTSDVGGLVGATPTGSGTFAGVAVVTHSFWNTSTGPATSAAGTGRTTAQLQSLATFEDATWDIVAGWRSPSVTPARTWGICSGAESGHPFLQSLVSADPCGGSTDDESTDDTSTSSAASEGLVLSCDVDAPRVGETVRCAVSGAPPTFDILWRAAHSAPFLEGVIGTSATGTAAFEFVVPASAVSQPLTVELVAWTAPLVVIGGVEGPAPAAIPAGAGPESDSIPLALLVTALAVAAGGSVSIASRQRGRRGLLRFGR